ncbi:MAG: hypothetical protein ACR2M1_16940, partial [Gemmatimonadaceae bacterium]
CSRHRANTDACFSGPTSFAHARLSMSAPQVASNVVAVDRFAIYIDYDRESADAARVFRVMAAFIDAIQQLDFDLAHAVAAEAEASTRLTAVEAASLKAWIDSIIGYADGGNVPMTPPGHVERFISRAREKVLGYVGGHSTVESAADVAQIRAEISQIAEEEGVTAALTYNTPVQKTLLADMQQLGEATADLSRDDRLEYQSDRAVIPVTEKFSLASERIDELLTYRTDEDILTEVLAVKKPDYLGHSMWQFKYHGKNVDAKMDDADWLARFHARQVVLRPGDALRARVHAIVRYGEDGSLVSERYAITKVLAVLPADRSTQPPLPFKDVA